MCERPNCPKCNSKNVNDYDGFIGGKILTVTLKCDDCDCIYEVYYRMTMIGKTIIDEIT